MWKSMRAHTQLLESEALRKMVDNTQYLLELNQENLLFPYQWQAGLTGSINRKMPELHGGWDAQSSHIRGTFTGHWLSAAAHTVAEKPCAVLLARANDLVDELYQVQQANGGQWVFPIPEDYITGARQGKGFWAPIYVCHKVLMGLLDMHVYAGSALALTVIENATAWFEQFCEQTTDEALTALMDVQECGGIMELWADLFAVTGQQRYLVLMRKFERRPLFEGLLAGEDVLSNMHANTTIPEAHGAARAYEVTGEDRYRKIALAYWKCAVTDRGMFATGGQTSGEVWTPMNRQAARLGHMNQEYCTVYNMIRLAEYLYRWTGDSVYSDYIERNIINGLYAQGHFTASALEGLNEPSPPEKKLVAYYLPLRAGANKQWASKTDTFWCCVCTLVQANSRMREWIFHQNKNVISVDQFIPAQMETTIAGTALTIQQKLTDLGGSCNRINAVATSAVQCPAYIGVQLHIQPATPARFGLRIRAPWWLSGAMRCYLDDELLAVAPENGYLNLDRTWQDCCLCIELPKALHTWALPDEPDTVAILDGPTVLAGLVEEERMLYGNKANPESFVRPADERMWSSWTGRYKTFRQPVGFPFVPLNTIANETYTVYFPIEEK